MPKTNFNGTATAAGSKLVAAENNARRGFFFQNPSAADMVLNFGATATASNILTVKAGASIFFDKHSPYNFEKDINVYCASAVNYEAQGDE